jgi:hypothetical protein
MPGKSGSKGVKPERVRRDLVQLEVPGDRVDSFSQIRADGHGRLGRLAAEHGAPSSLMITDFSPAAQAAS